MDFAPSEPPNFAGAAARKDMELYLQQHESLVSALLDSAAQAILGVDRHGRLTLVNRRCEELFGYSRRELVGQEIEILLPTRPPRGPRQAS